MNLKELTVALCGTMSISGYEAKNTDVLISHVGKYFDEIKTDAVGNHLLIKKCGKEGAPKILVDTHFDEIGMIVTEIKDGGFLTVTSIGGLDPSIMQASEVKIYGKEILHGVVASTPPHLSSAADGDKLKKIDELLIDTGYSKEELEALAPIGTPVGFEPVYHELLGERIAGKSFDDKACAAAAIFGVHDLDKSALAGDVYILLSCHEETDREGGVAAATFAIDPDYAMVTDVNFARVPDTDKNETVVMGSGISLTISAVTDRRLTNLVAELCDEKNLGYTKCCAATHTGTNAMATGLVNRGVPVVDIGLPLKNMHTYTEIIDLADCRVLAELVRAFVTSEKIAEVFSK